LGTENATEGTFGELKKPILTPFGVLRKIGEKR